jgi:hypothetical protein
MEDENPLEAKEKMEEVNEHAQGWVRFLSISTAIIAVLAAIASLVSGNYANDALIDKNNAILSQSKASDQWNYYQAKGIKKNIAEGFFAQNASDAQKSDIAKYTTQQEEIQKSAKELEAKSEELNTHSEYYLEKHHKAAVSVTLFQIAIALSAMAALLRQKYLWLLSLSAGVVGLVFVAMALR